MSTLSRALNLDTKASELSGVGPAYVRRLGKLGIETVRDLLLHLPRRYDDFSHMAGIGEAKIGEVVSIKGRVLQVANKRTARKHMVVTEAVVADETGAVKATWFHQPYLAKTLREGEEVILSGKLEYRYGDLVMTSPEHEAVKERQAHTAGLVAVYPETEGVSSKWLRSRILPLLPLAGELVDILPEETRQRQGLPALAESVQHIHSPEDLAQAEEARRRFAFEELLSLQLLSQRIRLENRKTRAPKIAFNQAGAKKFVGALPFSLTSAQRKAAWEILQDLEQGTPMNRLLEGDVGSGKTVVAAMALHHTALAGLQGALMAPTEILAAQHYTRLSDMLAPLGVSLDLLRSSTPKKERDEIIARLASGETQVAVGTHALIQSGVRFHRLGLAIIDEQHRFGVEQRAGLRQENDGVMPHLLSMTATPIPRTLTLTVYGDLDLSVLDELPPGRTPVTTRRVLPHERDEAYRFIRGEIEAGRQVFVVCPLIEESDKLGVKSATVEYERLSKKILPEFRIGLLHGRLKGSEKEVVMAEFVSGKTQVLVTTTVVEVGVDVPNATVMVIEGAERFGLAQLHQLRGRVGRGAERSYCLLFSDSDSEEARARLDAVVGTQSGFELAERDLELRGPGEIYGKRQSGLPGIELSTLLDHVLVRAAKEEAERLLTEDPELEHHPLIRQRLQAIYETEHLE